MTIQDLYEWAKKNKAIDLDIEIQYRDDGGYYNGTCDLSEEDIEVENKSYSKVVVL